MSKAKTSDATLDTSVEDRVVAIAWRWFPVAVVVGTVVAGVFLGPGFGVLVVAAGAFIGAIAALWGSVRSLFGEAPLAGEDAFALGAPSTEEEQKRAVLRAIKDLEFERSVGKISDQDYRALVSKYRTEAKRLLRVLDERAAPARAEAEKLANARLRKAGILRDDEDAQGSDGADDEADEPAAEEPAAEESTAKEPAAKEPAAEEPAAKEPAAEEPAAKEPSGEAAAPTPKKKKRRKKRKKRKPRADEVAS